LGLFCLATMFLGTVVHRWHSGEVRLRTLACCVATATSAGAALLGSSGAAGTPGFVPMLTAWLGAYAIFGVGVALRRRAVPGWLRRLGTISYSVYLVQALVLIAVPALPSPVLSAALWAGLIVALSEVTYRVVEQPAVRLGRRVAAGRRPAIERHLHVAPVRPAGRRIADRPAVRTAAAPRRMAV
jgi:peptidoglycan/LPS O-acetylase OafA/YrhL